MARKAIIIGAGPAGLTAAYELLQRTDILPVIIESENQVGGLSKTLNFDGNRMDIGGHRFFSKSEKIIAWWLNMLPLQEQPDTNPLQLQYHNKNVSFSRALDARADENNFMMVRPRKSRIYFEKKFFEYPLKPGVDTLRKLGLLKSMKIACSFTTAQLFPDKPEKNLAQFFRNRFGKELYHTFFKDYTEKVWGESCETLPASWGHQRVKDLNFSKAFFQSLRSNLFPNKTLQQEGVSTSLIEQFLYPKYGPGHMWETVKSKVQQSGGEFHLNKKVTRLITTGKRITAVECTDSTTAEKQLIPGDFFLSTMPVKDLVMAIDDDKKYQGLTRIAGGLVYRNFIIAGLLINHRLSENNQPLKDNWIYLQDKRIRAGRLQIFNNWSEYMVKDHQTTWLGMEYFCSENDILWNSTPADIVEIAIREIIDIGLIQSKSEVISSEVEKIDKAYPAYTGTYDRFNELRTYTDSFSNLFLIGRNGMHRYNNTDHSMLTAMTAVENIMHGIESKENIWEVNVDEAYHEER